MTRPPHGPAPPRRQYPPPDPGRPPRSTDTTTLILHVGPAAFGFGVGLVWVIWTGGALPVYTPLFTAVGVWGITQLVLRVAAGTVGAYVDPSGGTTPHRAEYSQPQALAAQGRYREAVEGYELAAAESAGDPTPYIAIARIQRDHLADYESAAAWFRRARRDATLNPGEELLVAQELIELYRERLGEPRRAIPELARIQQIVPNTPQAESAARELADLRIQLQHDLDGDHDTAAAP